MISKEKTTADKRNAYRIRSRVSQAIFKEFIIAQGEEILKNTVVGRFDMPMLSALAGISARAIMKDPLLNVVLKKQG